jgi:hypothetical protein
MAAVECCCMAAAQPSVLYVTLDNRIGAAGGGGL